VACIVVGWSATAEDGDSDREDSPEHAATIDMTPIDMRPIGIARLHIAPIDIARHPVAAAASNRWQNGDTSTST
jgi:hypothetical protein